MIRKNPRGDLPVVHDSAFVDPTAILCGRVVVHENVFVGPYAVIRADEVDANGHMEAIVIGAHSNIQDGVVIHSKSGATVTVGERTSIAHRAIVHGPCTVGDSVFIGFNSVLFNCAVGEGCVVRHNAVVDGCDLPAGLYVPSTQRIGPRTDLATIPKVTADACEFSEDVVRTNNSLVQGYKRLEGEFLIMCLVLPWPIVHPAHGPTSSSEPPSRSGAFRNASWCDCRSGGACVLHLSAVLMITGIVLEHYARKLLFWLASVQAVVATIASDGDSCANEMAGQLTSHGLRIETDPRNEKIGYKIREHRLAKVPVLLVVGKREAKEGIVSLRQIARKDNETLTLRDAVVRLEAAEALRSTCSPVSLSPIERRRSEDKGQFAEAAAG